MREIKAEVVTAAVRQLCITANKVLPEDLVQCIGCARQTEPNSTAKSILGDLENNLAAAKELDLPICQDTGMAVVFAEIGQDVHIDGDFEAAVHAGVSAGYTDGLLRKSVVRDPFFDRVNTGDNTPAVIHTRLVPGDRVRLTVAPKGFGSENMSQIKMLTPSAGIEGVKQFILDAVKYAGPNPCPPIVVGIGIGGTFEKAAQLAKKATLRPINTKNEDPRYAKLEDELIEEINKMGFGPAGLGGNTTAIGVNVETYPTHIAGMPVAVNICCHAARHKEAVI